MGSEQPQESEACAPQPNGSNVWCKMLPADLIALVVIIGGLVLISLHIDGIIGGLLVSVVAYYFGAQKRPPSALAQ